MNLIYRHFPDSKTKWKRYARAFFPVVFGSIFFSFNSFVDNFMVGRYNGATALAIANTWTGIITGIFIGVASAGSIVLSQYYYDDQKNKAKEASRLRFLFSIIGALLMATLAWTIPTQLNQLFLSQPPNASASELITYQQTLDQANEYLGAIAFQWILMSITFNLGNQLREIGYAKVPLIWSIFTLGTNITLNIIFIQILDLGVVGAAWASVASRFVALLTGTSYIIYKKLAIGTLPWQIFKISPQIYKEFFKRWYLVISLATTFFFINFRNFFYDGGFPTGSIAQGVGALAVLGLTGAIMSVFTSIFSATRVLAANFVGSELGKNNIKQAVINSDQLKGFNTLMAILFSVLLAIVAIFVPYFTFLVNENVASGQDGAISIDVGAQLLNVRDSLFVVASMIPFWIYLTSTYDNANSGGKNFIMAFAEWILNGVGQLGWCALVMLVMVPNSEILSSNFALAYFIFFISDYVKLVFLEVIYHKVDWAHSITHPKKEENKELVPIKSS